MNTPTTYQLLKDADTRSRCSLAPGLSLAAREILIGIEDDEKGRRDGDFYETDQDAPAYPPTP